MDKSQVVLVQRPTSGRPTPTYRGMRQAADRRHVPIQRLRRWCREGAVAAIKVGSRWLIPDVGD